LPRLQIDNHDIHAPQGATILEAARLAGVEIPSLCAREGCNPEVSCMVCVVKVAGRSGLVPSCATIATEGMVVESDSEEVQAARRAALELLLSDHLGDCLAPCHISCPTGMNIPRMIRSIQDGRFREAIETVKAHIALPATLGRICDAPCERACRRGAHDASVSIRLLKRFVGDTDLASSESFSPSRAPESRKRVAIVGAGPAGLSAAFHLLQQGHACTILDARDEPGGMLRYGVDPDRLPREVLDAEISVIRRMGAELRPGETVADAGALEKLRREWDAVLLATGALGEEQTEHLGLAIVDGRLNARTPTMRTAQEGVFAAGDLVRKVRRAARAVGDGRLAAIAIRQYLAGEDVEGEVRPFSTHVGRPLEGEMDRFLGEARNTGSRERPPEGGSDALSAEAARREAMRCLHCDCRKPEACLLRKWSATLGARGGRFRAERRRFEQDLRHELVVYEPGKCIACGLCVQIARREAEPLGLTFVGRGFDVRVGVPFEQSLADGLTQAAEACARACPTGALALRNDP
jgi:glutamate synthase (NADPH) small chain